MSLALQNSPLNKVTLVPLVAGCEYLLWAEKEIRFLSMRPLQRTLAGKSLVNPDSNPWPEAAALAELERGLTRLGDLVSIEERFIFHVQAAILRATFRYRTAEASHSDSSHAPESLPARAVS